MVPWPAAVAAALIQLRGPALQPGVMSGAAVLPLERAAGGDTPVLSFSVDSGAGAQAHRVRLLLDTGASSTLVSPELVRRLGLSSSPVPARDFDLAGAGEGCPALEPRRTRLPALRLGGSPGRGGPSLRLLGAEALVLPVAGLPADVDGVLGAPQLRQLPLWIDPPGGRLVLGAPAPAQAPAPALAPAGSGSTSLELRWQRGVPLLPLALSLPSPPGSPPPVVPALADTGAEGLFVTPRLAGILRIVAPARPLRVSGFCGVQPARGLEVLGPHLPGTAAGPEPDTALQASVTVNPVFEALAVEAIVGQELLRNRRQLWRLDTTPPTLTLW